MTLKILNCGFLKSDLQSPRTLAQVNALIRNGVNCHFVLPCCTLLVYHNPVSLKNALPEAGDSLDAITSQH